MFSHTMASSGLFRRFLLSIGVTVTVGAGFFADISIVCVGWLAELEKRTEANLSAGGCPHKRKNIMLLWRLALIPKKLVYNIDGPFGQSN